MCVNLSTEQFEDPRLVDEVTEVVEETGVDPSSLALEIAENVLMSDPQSVAAKPRALRRLGVRIVVDNFGTVYSSLPRLGRFPMDFLNIDRSFNVRLGVEPEDTTIVSTMTNLAHSLGWEATAEGVEAADQLARWRELGCDMAQGYYLWEPIVQREGICVSGGCFIESFKYSALSPDQRRRASTEKLLFLETLIRMARYNN